VALLWITGRPVDVPLGPALVQVRDTFTESYKPGTFDYEFEAEFLRLRDAAEKKSIESKQAGSKAGGATKGTARPGTNASLPTGRRGTTE
jgi:hypothetical protein